VITGKLDKKAGDAPWVQAIEKHGIWVQVLPVDTAALPAWLRGRAKMLHIDIDPEACQLIVDRVEGNLLAAQQELAKLKLMASGGSIGVDLVLRSVGDSARAEERGSGTDADFVGTGAGAARNVAGART
jgi:DNA polymerase-3 subunit delta